MIATVSSLALCVSKYLSHSLLCRNKNQVLCKYSNTSDKINLIKFDKKFSSVIETFKTTVHERKVGSLHLPLICTYSPPFTQISTLSDSMSLM